MPSNRLLASDLRNLTDHIAQYAPGHDNDGSFPVEAFAEFARLGVLADPPIERGGMERLMALLVAIGTGDLNAGRIFEGHVNSVWLIETFGRAATRELARAELLKGAIFGVWNTDVPDAPLQLIDGTLLGKKNFASGVDGLTHAIVTVTDADGRRMILVPLNGLPVDRSWWKPMGMKSSGSHIVDFTGLRVLEPHVIGIPDDYVTQPWFSAGAMRFLAVQTGGMQAVFEIALAHLRQTGRADNPHQVHRLARMGAAVETALLWMEQCARVWTETEQLKIKEANERLVATANGARGVIEALALQVLIDAEQAIGAAGMIAPHRFERTMRDLRTYLRQPNPDGAAAAFGTAIAVGHWSPRTIGTADVPAA